jgi:peptidoglycan/LPS O-acetylase OafA/YrhL
MTKMTEHKTFSFRINNFDLIRLIAAAQVMIVHGYNHFELTGGKAIMQIITAFPGVPIFFGISGFLIAASFDKNRELKGYFVNRVLRIYPALWVCFLVSLTVVYLSNNFPGINSEFVFWTINQISVGQFYNPEFLRDFGVGVINGSLWTIPVELQFYLVLPLVYLFLDKLISWKSVLALLLILIAVNQYYIVQKYSSISLPIKLLGVTVLPYLYMFLIGVLMQRNLWFVRKYLARNFVPILLLYVATGLALSWFGLKTQGNYLNPVSATMLVLLTISAAYTKEEALNRVLGGVDISYGVYIYHMLVVNVLVQYSQLAKSVEFVIMIISTTVLAYLSWTFVEKPALGLKRKFSVKGKN